MSPGLPARSLDEGDTHQRLDPLESVRFHVSSSFQSRRILRDGGMTGRVWNDASQRPFHLGKGHSIGREKEKNRNSGFGGEGRYSRKGTVRGPAQCRWGAGMPQDGLPGRAGSISRAVKRGECGEGTVIRGRGGGREARVWSRPSEPSVGAEFIRSVAPYACVSQGKTVTSGGPTKQLLKIVTSGCKSDA